MDIVFDCPNCNQELAVDSSGAGSDIECPSCHETITIPAASTKTASAPPPDEPPAPSLAPSVMASSAAAKVEMHLKVPVSNKPGEILIKKAATPLGAKTTGEKGICVHTIRHDKCIENGHDLFDETAAKFLNTVGEANIIEMHTVSFSHVDVGSQKLLTTFGLMVIYRG